MRCLLGHPHESPELADACDTMNAPAPLETVTTYTYTLDRARTTRETAAYTVHASQPELLSTAEAHATADRCSVCHKPINPFNVATPSPTQRALIPGAPEMHAACLAHLQDRKDGRA